MQLKTKILYGITGAAIGAGLTIYALSAYGNRFLDGVLGALRSLDEDTECDGEEELDTCCEHDEDAPCCTHISYCKCDGKCSECVRVCPLEHPNKSDAVSDRGLRSGSVLSPEDGHNTAVGFETLHPSSGTDKSVPLNTAPRSVTPVMELHPEEGPVYYDN